MTQTSYAPTAKFAENAHIDQARYEALYAQSIEDPISFWAEHGKRVDWIKPFETVKNVSYEHPDVSIKWFEDGTLNVSANTGSSIAARCDPTPIASPSDCAASARRILISRAMSVPPVMLDRRSGADRCLPNAVQPVSTAFKSISGSATCSK